MAESLVGAGGWGYFSGGLEAYAKAYRFVEVNATFYRHIPDPTARRWRAQVPSDFVFSVKAHRDVSHRDRLRGSSAGRAAFAQTLRTARLLRAPFVVLETPAFLPFDSSQAKGLRDLAAMVPGGVRIGLEARAYAGRDLPAALRRAMEEGGILDVVDLSQSEPRVPDEVQYTRLFGPGPHNVYQFDDEELREIDRRASDAVRVAFTFHGVRMYSDAARFLTFKRTGAFPPATPSRGLASLESVLAPDARFPSSKDDLVRQHGWKVIDLDDETRAHAVRLLATLPRQTFRDVGEVVRALGSASPDAKTG
jgi:uncharacterized protein YecE (DUF72 family)